MSDAAALIEGYSLVRNTETDEVYLWNSKTHSKHVVDMDDYQKLASRTAGPDVFEDPAYTAIGLAEEAGEFAGVIKKEKYHKHPEDRSKKLKELGDVLWYLAMAAKTHGFTMSEIASTNVVKLWRRYPEGFNSKASINRAEGDD